MDRMRVIYKGKVQGVWFRAHCQKKAIELGLVGWVRNLPDGTVESVAEGDIRDLQELLRWCSNDQPIARVTGTEVTFEPSRREFGEFRIV
ncbi:MAG: acylphosphatase [Candidatus Thermoplasmatota archaeon]|nr:acylphosphatase [Candidatus Thermoplasmatota archaeon]